jgi:hypothetical protein
VRKSRERRSSAWLTTTTRRAAGGDTFDDEAGRDAQLNGKVTAALMEKPKSGDLFANTPRIHKLRFLADKLPK